MKLCRSYYTLTAFFHFQFSLDQKRMALQFTQKVLKPDNKLKSDVWLYFEIVESNGEKKTKCQICDTKLSYKSNSTKTM